MKDHDLAALRARAISNSPSDDPKYSQQWAQYHNALQGMYERGALVPVGALQAERDAGYNEGLEAMRDVIARMGYSTKFIDTMTRIAQ